MELKENQILIPKNELKINNDQMNQLILENKILKTNLQSIEKQFQSQLIKTKDLSNQFNKVNGEAEEYKIQLQNLQKTIEILQYESKEQLLKISDLEEKLKYYQDQKQELDNGLQTIKETETKIFELNVLLKEARKQNISYANQINELKKDELMSKQLTNENSYLQQENMTLKAYIVSQNKSSHYGNAFKDLKVEQYCLRCSSSILELCQKLNSNEKNYKEGLLPETKDIAKSDYNATAETLRNSTLYTVSLSEKEVSQKKAKESAQKNISLPKVNKQLVKQIMDKCDLSADAITVAVRTIFHLGDQVEVLLDWKSEKPVKGTIKYIGNLDDRYRSSVFLGVKLHIKPNDLPVSNFNDGCFGKKRFFNIETMNGCFVHYSNVLRLYNKETAQFEELGEFLSRALDPTINKYGK